MDPAPETECTSYSRFTEEAEAQRRLEAGPGLPSWQVVESHELRSTATPFIPTPISPDPRTPTPAHLVSLLTV